MFTRQVLLAAISCYGTARIAAVSSFAFIPSTRPSVGQSRPTFPPLFATGDGGAQQEKNVIFASEKKEDDAVKLADGLNLEKFNEDLEEFSTDKDTMRKNVDDDISNLPKPESLVIPWKFQGKYDIRVEVTYPKLDWKKCDGFSSTKVPQNLPVVLLVHGFGCSIVYWRQTVRALAKQGYVVYAMDLLGHGKSAKASEDVTYSTALWAEQLDDFCEQILTEDEDIVLIGNSVGSLVSLLAASGSFSSVNKREEDACIRKRLRGIGMFNCGIGLNIHGITQDPKWDFVERFFLNKIFDAMESSIVFGNIPLVRWILENIATKPILEKVLLQLYGCAEDPSQVVDNELVNSFFDPVAGDTESVAKVLSQILTNDSGPTPREVHGRDGILRHLPIHVVWGESDEVIPLKGIGGVAQFYEEMAAIEGDAGSNSNKVTMEVIEGGHIPFDEVPEVANGAMLRWLNEL